MTVRITKPEFNLREKIAELDKPSGIKGNEILRSETTQDARDLIRADRRRLNFNGAMMINQRGNVTGVTQFFKYHGPDRYYTQGETSNNGTWSIGQSTDVPEGYGFEYSLDYSCTTTSSNVNRYLMTLYRMEGFDSQVFDYGTPDAKTVTLSFWIKCSKAGDFQVNFENEQNPDAGYQTKQTIHTAGQWEKKIVTIPGDTTKAFTWTSAKAMCFDIVYSAFGFYASQTPTAAWSPLANGQRGTHCNMDLFDSTSNYVRITGVQLELGNQATEFEHFSFKEELELCQRYYYTTRGGSVGVPNTDHGGFFGVPLNNSGSAFGQATFPVTMRATPSITLYDGNGAAGQFTQNGNNYFTGSAGAVTSHGFSLATRSSGNLSDDANLTVTAGFTADAEI